MDKDDWCKACRDLAEAQSRIQPSVPDLRDALVDLDQLVRSAPWAVRNSFTEISEQELADASADHLRRIEAGTLAWPHKAVGHRRALLALAIQIRAVDALLAALNTRQSRPPARSAREWRCSDGRAYVIPCRRERDFGSSAGDALGYGRRGVLAHRIIPVMVSGMPVRIVLIGTLESKAATAPLRLGAALFPALTLESRASGDGFRADKVVHEDVGAAIEAQVHNLGQANAIVWPELTIDDDGLEFVQAALAAKALAEETPLKVAIAGSWHRPGERSGAVGNVAPILDGTGERRDEYAKVAKFKHDTLGWEDIAQGEELVVLVCDGFLASVAICKDYCDLNDDPPWRHLDVDLMLVPSMGNGTTMAGHLSHANRNRIHTDQRAFVVQHGIPKSDGDPKGFVLFGDRNPPTDPSAVRTDDEWEMRSL